MSEDIFDKNDIQSSDKEAHSDYKPVDQGDETVKHQLSGMYQSSKGNLMFLTCNFNFNCL